MSQLLLRLKPGTERPIRPGELRSIVASLDRHAHGLFARDEHGQTVSSPAARFVGGHGWVGVVVDDGHADLLMRHSGEIILAASKHLGRAVPVEFEQHEHSLVKTQFVHHYRALNVAIKRRGPSARESNIDALASRRIVASLLKQSTVLGMDVPEEQDLEIACIEVDRTVGVQLKTDAGLTNEWMTVIPSLSFTSFADLKGFWFVGNLSSRGHGRVVRQRVLPGATKATVSEGSES